MWARRFHATVEHPFATADLRELGEQAHHRLLRRPGYDGALLAVDRRRTTMASFTFWSTQKDLEQSADVILSVRGVLRALGFEAEAISIDELEVVSALKAIDAVAAITIDVLSLGEPRSQEEFSRFDARTRSRLSAHPGYRGRCLLAGPGEAVSVGLWNDFVRAGQAPEVLEVLVALGVGSSS